MKLKRLLFPLLTLLLVLLLIPRAQAEEVATSAKACIIIDEASGRVLLSHNAETPLPMASTTKVMTALLALERGNLGDPVTCSRNAFGVPGTSIYLSQGETLSLREMLYGLMLASGNDAAVAIAEHIGGTAEEFCRMMTARAAELGCQNTFFLTPHGLPCDGHYTTAHDLALIARQAMTLPLFREIVSTRRATIPWEGRPYSRVLSSKNKLLTTYEGATGIKTGYTRKAGRCLVFGAERNGMRIIGVVLNCPDWFDEAARLMDRAFQRYESVTMLNAGESLRTLPVAHSGGASVHAVLAADLRGVVMQGAIPSIEIDLGSEELDAPVIRGTPLGVARLISGGEVIASTCAYPEIAALWLDYRYTDEGRLLLNYGVEGEGFEYVDGEPQLTELITGAENINFGLAMYATVFLGYNEPERMWSTYSDAQMASLDIWKMGDNEYGYSANAIMNTQEQETFSRAYSDINTYLLAEIVRFVIGDRSLDEFDDYVADVKAMGIDACIECKQAALDRYLD